MEQISSLWTVFSTIKFYFIAERISLITYYVDHIGMCEAKPVVRSLPTLPQKMLWNAVANRCFMGTMKSGVAHNFAILIINKLFLSSCLSETCIDVIIWNMISFLLPPALFTMSLQVRK